MTVLLPHRHHRVLHLSPFLKTVKIHFMLRNDFDLYLLKKNKNTPNLRVSLKYYIKSFFLYLIENGSEKYFQDISQFDKFAMSERYVTYGVALLRCSVPESNLRNGSSIIKN